MMFLLSIFMTIGLIILLLIIFGISSVLQVWRNVTSGFKKRQPAQQPREEAPRKPLDDGPNITTDLSGVKDVEYYKED